MSESLSDHAKEWQSIQKSVETKINISLKDSLKIITDDLSGNFTIEEFMLQTGAKLSEAMDIIDTLIKSNKIICVSKDTYILCKTGPTRKKTYNPEIAKSQRLKKEFNSFINKLPNELIGNWQYLAAFMVAANNKGHLANIIAIGDKLGRVEFDELTEKYKIIK